MGKRLVITEKPSVARDIVGALGGFTEEEGFWESDDYIVTFAVGHLLELVAPEDIDEKYKRWTLDTLPILPERFPLKPKEGTRDRLRTIKKLLHRDDVENVVNACDAGREGELIFREVVEYLESAKPIERLWLQSMTKKAITDGFSKLTDGTKFDGLSEAAHCRNYSDWLIGMNATRALTRRLKSRSENQAWSAGRVQTPTLGMLVDRELEVLEHSPIPYWRIKATFDQAGTPYDAVWFDPNFKAENDDDKEDRIFEEARANAILEKVKGKPALASETRKPSREAAPPLFDLTSLQREANRRFGWSARRTLNAAQRCYEAHKVLTYPRTDTRALPNDYRAVVEEVIVQLGADERFAAASARLAKDGLLNTEKIFDDAKVTDHFAIVPTGTIVADLGGDDGRLFDLVARRFMGAFHPPAIWSRVERTTVVEEEHFRSREKVLQIPGWREVLPDPDAGSSMKLPPLADGDEANDVPVGPGETEVEADETKPPPRITEARLLSLMENAGKAVDDEDYAEAMKDSGIGTPATRADTIENLISKAYVLRAGRVLRPSVKGLRLIDILRRMNADRLASPALTGQLEKQLSEVEHRSLKSDHFMKEVYDYTKEIVELTKGFEFVDLFPDDESLGKCPLCSKDVYERSWFYRCKEPEGLEAARKLKKAKKKAGEDPNEVPEIVDCPFRIWKDKSGRYVDRRTVRELLADGKSRILDGFMTRQGRTYRGELEIADGEVQLKRVAGGESADDLGMPEYEVDDSPLGQCPQCKEANVVETRSTFICESGLKVLRALERDDTTLFPVKKKEIPEEMTYCPFLLPRTVCKREITRDEATSFVKDGQTPLLQEFTSRRGRPFVATLHLKENGRHGFEFPPRGEGGGKKKATKKKATKKKATKKKATKKKTTKKTASKKKTTTKKKTAAKKTTAKKTTTKKKTAAKKTAAKKTAAKKADVDPFEPDAPSS
ncbi:MAG: DNA topoisomerase 3 [Deltaproteobacteria bacterium]